MNIVIDAVIDVKEIPRKYKFMTINGEGQFEFWEERPKFYYNSNSWYGSKPGKFIGRVSISNVKIEPSLHELEKIENE